MGLHDHVIALCLGVLDDTLAAVDVPYDCSLIKDTSGIIH